LNSHILLFFCKNTDFLGEKHGTHRSVVLPARVFTLARIHTQERAGSVVLRKKPLRGGEAGLVCIFTLMKLPQMSKQIFYHHCKPNGFTSDSSGLYNSLEVIIITFRFFEYFDLSVG